MRALEEDELGIGDAPCNQPCVGILDHVVGARYHQCLCLDGRKLGWGYVGVIHHEAEHLGVRLGFRTPFCEQACDAVTDFDGELRHELHAARVEIGTVQYQLIDALGITQSEDHGDVAAIGEAEDVGFRDMVEVHELEQVVGKLTDGEGGAATRRLTVTTRVDGIDVILLGKLVDLPHEIGAVFAVAMQEDDGLLTVPFLDIKVLKIHIFASKI